MLKNIIYSVLILSVLGCSNDNLKSKIKKSSKNLVIPNKKQIEWANAEIGVLIHYDLITYEPEYIWKDDWDYNPSLSIFNPKSLNTDQWVLAAKEAGAKYAVLVAKHCVGFSLWPTKAHEYSVKNTPWKNGKGDIVGDFIKSCNKYGIKPGLYSSSSANGYLKVDNPGLVVTNDSIAQKEYNKIVETQLTELWSNYGELFEIWFDGGVLPPEKGGADIVPILKKYQPNAIVFQGPYNFNNLIRWVGNERGLAPYPCWSTADSTTNSNGVIQISGLNGNPDGKYWCPGETDVPIRKNSSFQGGWFWKEGEDSKLRSLAEMQEIYYNSVGRNTNLLLGVVINDKGLVPNADVELLKQFGNSINEIFSTPIVEVSGKKTEFLIDLKKSRKINNIVMMEDIKYGERVRKYTIEGFSNDKWTKLCEGESIGHKRLERLENVNASKIRIHFDESVAQPIIKKIILY